MASPYLSNSPTLSTLVAAGEALFATLSGKALSASLLKVSAGTTSVVDGLLPTLASHVAFDLDGVLVGATAVLQGLNTAVVAAKTNTTQGIAPAQSSTTAVASVSSTV